MWPPFAMDAEKRHAAAITINGNTDGAPMISAVTGMRRNLDHRRMVCAAG